MSDGQRNTTLKALVDETIVELMPKTSGEQVYLDANTKLSPKVAEMVSAINLRTKKTEHIADVETLNATIDTKVADAIHNSDTKNSELRTYVDENVAAINESMTSSHTAINDAIASANADIALRAKQTDVNSAISSLSTSVDNKLAEKANITDVDTKISNLKQEILGDLPVENYDTFTELAAYIAEHKELADSITEAIETKANKTDVNSALDLKANKTDVESALSGKVNTSDLVDPGNATITLIQDGAIKGTFTANQTNNVEITLDANNPTYFPMVGASSAEAGKEGLVPAPAAGKQSSFLRGDGTWALPTDTKYTLESFGVSATAAEINHLGGATSNIQVQLNSKVDIDEFYEAIANVDNSVTLTQAEYDALSDEEKARDITYYITDGDVQQTATAISFTSSVYNAKNVGDALNEVKNSVNETNSNLGLVRDALNEVKNSVNETNSSLESCFQSVSNGKALVASAITDKGVNTDATATFEVMANNIKSIQTSITPTAKHSNGTSSSSVSLTAGTYIVFCGGAAGCCQNYDGNSYPGTNWVYSVAVSISGGSYSALTDSGHGYNNGCGLRTLTYLVVVPSSCTVTTSVSVGGAYQNDTAPRSSTIAVKIK